MRRSIHLTAVALCAAAVLSGVVARADVTGAGDVSPQGPVDLPIDGGPATEIVIVGGAGVDPFEVGELTIDLGFITLPLESPGGILGNTPNSLGNAFVTGLTSEWRIDGLLTVGLEGTGRLEVSSGARVTTNLDNTVGVDDDDIIIGDQEFSEGEIRVRGFATRVENLDMTVGNEGIGRLIVEQEGRVFSDTVYVGRELEGTGFVEVTGRATTMRVNDEIIVGVAGRGFFDIADSAIVRSEFGFIGDLAGSYGEVRVSGGGTLWQLTENLTVGNPMIPSANGVLEIGEGALVRVDDTGTSGSAMTIALAGRVDMRGGTLLSTSTFNDGLIRGYGRLEAPLTNGPEGEIRNGVHLVDLRERLHFTEDVFNEGLIESSGGEFEFETLVTNRPLGQIVGRNAVYRFGTTLERAVFHLENEGQLAFAGGVSDVHGSIHNATDGEIVVGNDADVTFYNEVDNEGSIAVLPGGTAVFLRDLSFSPSSTLLLQLASAGEEQLAQVQVGGEAVLAGTIEVELRDGFVPQVGDSFQVVTAENVNGTFDFQQLPLVSGINWLVGYTPTTVTLNAIGGGAFLNADFNLDGVVSGPDLLIWQRGYETGTTHAEGDANGDGVVDAFDRSVWESQFGSSPTNLASAQVPEPSGIALAISGIGAAWFARRRKIANVQSPN